MPLKRIHQRKYRKGRCRQQPLDASEILNKISISWLISYRQYFHAACLFNSREMAVLNTGASASIFIFANNDDYINATIWKYGA